MIQQMHLGESPCLGSVDRAQVEWVRSPMSRKKMRAQADTMTARCALETGLNGDFLALDIIAHPDGSSSVCTYPVSPGDRLLDRDVVLRAKTLDKEWFRDHPYRSHRLRRAIPGEFSKVSAEIWVAVRQVLPGCRLRVPFEALIPLPSEDAPEHIAHALYDLLSESGRKPVFADQLAKRSRTYEVAPDPKNPSSQKPRYWH